MKKLVLFSALAVSVVAALLFFRTREEYVALKDFTWSERDGVVTFEFRVTNLTEQESAVSVQLIAERTLELRTGPQITEAGRGRVEVRLNAREEKKANGLISFAPAVKGSLTVFPYMTVKKLNQPTLP